MAGMLRMCMTAMPVWLSVSYMRYISDMPMPMPIPHQHPNPTGKKGNTEHRKGHRHRTGLTKRNSPTEDTPRYAVTNTLRSHLHNFSYKTFKIKADCVVGNSNSVRYCTVAGMQGMVPHSVSVGSSSCCHLCASF